MKLGGWLLPWAVAVCMGMGPAFAGTPDFKGEQASAEARQLVRWAVSGDARGKPFAIVDKKAARLYVFDARHRFVGASSVLIGQTPGDHTVDGVGERAALGQVGPDERTTPAGRFESEPGRNHLGEANVWLDFDSAFAIHRVRPGPGLADRLARLRSATPADNRASLGCVVAPVDFYLGVVEPLLGRTRGVVYVLPEIRSIESVFAPEG